MIILSSSRCAIFLQALVYCSGMQLALTITNVVRNFFGVKSNHFKLEFDSSGSLSFAVFYTER